LKILLDTCVLAEVRKPQCNPKVRAAVSDVQDRDLFVSVITIGEITKAISLLADGQKKDDLEKWLSGLGERFGDRILAIDRATASIWGEITAKCQCAGSILPTPDGLIAATALRHGLCVMTRNVRHFEVSGVSVIDPWQEP